METLFNTFNHWGWWTLAIALVVLEAFAPGTFFLWMGVSSAVVGLTVFFIPELGWEYQIMLFALLSVATIAIWRVYFKSYTDKTDQPRLNRRGYQYVDRRFILDEPIVNGYGKLKVDDTTWRIAGEDMPEGTPVKVVDVDGVLLKVERVA